MHKALSIILVLISNYIYTQHIGYKFIENKNQWPENVNYKADLKSGYLYIENDGFLFDFYDAKTVSKYVKSHYDKSYNIHKKDIKHHSYKVEFLNYNNEVEIIGDNKSEEYYNYFLGNDKDKWASDANAYYKIAYKNLYDGINLNIYSRLFNLKYDFIISPNANISDIKLKYSGQDNIEIKNGRLHIYSQVNHIIEDKPFAYQIINDTQVEVECEYQLKENVLSYKFPNDYNHNYELVIDPVLIFSTYSGSFSNNFGYSATFDSKGFLYSGSSAFGNSYPTTIGAYNTNWNSGIVDIAISKFDTTGTFLIYSTYIGGNSDELPHSLIVNSFDELFILGTTSSPNFPTTTNAYDSTFNGGSSNNLTNGLGVNFTNGADIIVSHLSNDGTSLMGSTYIGGTNNDGLNSTSATASLNTLRYNYADEIRGEIDIDENNNIYVVSCTQSTDFPIVGNVFQQTYGGGDLDGCIIKLDNELENIIWSSFIGGENHDAAYSLALDNNQDIYISGGTSSTLFPVTPTVLDTSFVGGRSDGFISHINKNGQQIINSSYFGSTSYDQSYFVELDRYDNVYLFGQTEILDSTFIHNANWFVYGGGQFVSKLSAELDSVIYSTVFGSGSGINISPTAFLVDLCNKIYLAGWGGSVNNLSTLSNNAGYTLGMPITTNAFQNTTDGSDFYIMVLEDDASSLVYGSYFGGSSASEHVDGGTSRFDRKGKIYQAICAGCGGFSDLPTHPVNAVSSSNNNNCNLGVFKMDFDLPIVLADFDTPPIGCEPYTYTFVNTSLTQGNTNYFWDFGDGFTSSSFNPTHTYQTAGTYQISLIVNDTATCNLGDTITKDIIILGDTSYNLADINLCPGDNQQIGTLPNPNPQITYLWTPSTFLSDSSVSNPFVFPSSTISYTLLISNGICTDTAYQTVIVNTPLLTLPNDTTLCSDTFSISLTANSQGTSTEYIWSHNSQFTDTINSSINNPTINYSPTTNTTLFVQINNNGCYLYDSINIFIANAGTSISSDSIICFYDSALLIISNLIPGDSLSHDWYPDNIILNDDTNDSIWVNPTQNSYIYVTSLSNISGCLMLDSAFVIVDSLPIIGVSTSATYDTIIKGASTTLSASPNGYDYSWQPSSSLDNPNSQNPIATPDETTTYYVTYQSAAGCIKTDSITIYIKEVTCGPPDIFLPSAFTPNSDNNNDLLKVRGNNITSEDFVFRIFDRWGNMMFETFDKDEGWDGFYKDKLCNPAVYVYYFEVKCIGNETYFEKGNITLIR